MYYLKLNKPYVYIGSIGLLVWIVLIIILVLEQNSPHEDPVPEKNVHYNIKGQELSKEMCAELIKLNSGVKNNEQRWDSYINSYDNCSSIGGDLILSDLKPIKDDAATRKEVDDGYKAQKYEYNYTTLVSKTKTFLWNLKDVRGFVKLDGINEFVTIDLKNLVYIRGITREGKINPKNKPILEIVSKREDTDKCHANILIPSLRQLGPIREKSAKPHLYWSSRINPTIKANLNGDAKCRDIFLNKYITNSNYPTWNISAVPDKQPKGKQTNSSQANKQPIFEQSKNDDLCYSVRHTSILGKLYKACIGERDSTSVFIQNNTKSDCDEECVDCYHKTLYNDTNETKTYSDCKVCRNYSVKDKCVNDCKGQISHYYYVEHSNICVEDCPPGLALDGHTCKSTCTDSDAILTFKKRGHQKVGHSEFCDVKCEKHSQDELKIYDKSTKNKDDLIDCTEVGLRREKGNEKQNIVVFRPICKSYCEQFKSVVYFKGSVRLNIRSFLMMAKYKECRTMFHNLTTIEGYLKIKIEADQIFYKDDQNRPTHYMEHNYFNSVANIFPKLEKIFGFHKTYDNYDSTPESIYALIIEGVSAFKEFGVEFGQPKSRQGGINLQLIHGNALIQNNRHLCNYLNYSSNIFIQYNIPGPHQTTSYTNIIKDKNNKPINSTCTAQCSSSCLNNYCWETNNEYACFTKKKPNLLTLYLQIAVILLLVVLVAYGIWVYNKERRKYIDDVKSSDEALRLQ